MARGLLNHLAIRGPNNLLSLEGGKCNLWRHGIKWGKRDAGANHHHCGQLLQLYIGNDYAAHLLLQPTNSGMLIQPGQGDGSHTEGLITPTQQIKSQQALTKVT